MEAAKDRRIFAVSAINRETTDWTALVQVVERHRVQVGSGKHGKTGKRYRRYMFVDEHGTKVSGIVFESDIHFFEHKLLPFKRYNQTIRVGFFSFSILSATTLKSGFKAYERVQSNNTSLEVLIMAYEIVKSNNAALELPSGWEASYP